VGARDARESSTGEDGFQAAGGAWLGAGPAGDR
jgi:hypothetical protein